MTNIQWTDETWNPVSGCDKVSPGCTHCYAGALAETRLRHLPRYRDGFFGNVREHPDKLGDPLSWRKPRRVFVNSMSDLFHEDVPFEFIAAVFGVMAACPQHTFQILTKRPARMREWFEWAERSEGPADPFDGRPMLNKDIGRDEIYRLLRRKGEDGRAERLGVMGFEFWPLPNVWLGVSVEDQQRADERIPLLLQCPAAVRFISAEPLLGPIDLSGPRHPGIPEATFVKALDWVIVGGESGPGARPCNIDWIRAIADQTDAAGVACFVKQLGSKPYRRRHARGGPQGTEEALADMSYERPDRGWFSGWTLTHTPDGKTAYFSYPNLKDKKGGDPSEWPFDLRVREFPREYVG